MRILSEASRGIITFDEDFRKAVERGLAAFQKIRRMPVDDTPIAERQGGASALP